MKIFLILVLTKTFMKNEQILHFWLTNKISTQPHIEYCCVAHSAHNVDWRYFIHVNCHIWCFFKHSYFNCSHSQTHRIRKDRIKHIIIFRQLIFVICKNVAIKSIQSKEKEIKFVHFKMSKSREDKENLYAATIEQRMMSHEAYGKPWVQSPASLSNEEANLHWNLVS